MDTGGRKAWAEAVEREMAESLTHPQIQRLAAAAMALGGGVSRAAIARARKALVVEISDRDAAAIGTDAEGKAPRPPFPAGTP